MATINDTQRTSWILAFEVGLRHQVDAVQLGRKIRRLASGTLRFYRQKIALFQTFCDDQGFGTVSQLSPTLNRQYLLWLSDTRHNPGDVHGCYRTLR